MKRWAVFAVLLALGTAGCSETERKWMKLSGSYSTDDLRRDLTACTTNKVLNDKCMEDRGWVSMNPGKEDLKSVRSQDLERDRAQKGRY